MQPPRITALEGRYLGQYEIIEQIGHGGMAMVYKALQPALRRHVAIKVLPPFLVHEEGFLVRFQHEAETVAQLQHPNILPIFDYGRTDDIPYIVMPLVTGGTLRNWLAQGVPLDRALQVFRRILSALEYAHTRQPSIVHRDIKPSNILLNQDEWPLLADFGIAKILESSEHLTRSGMLMGTPEYMAPEQSDGRAVDHRADIYSMGVVLYELLSGRPPFHGDTPMAVILQHIRDRAPSPRTFRADLPPVWDEIIERSLAKAPAERYPSASAMDEAVQAAWRVVRRDRDAWQMLAPVNVADLYQRAVQARAQGDWQRVVGLCGQILEIDPAHVRAVDLLTQATEAAGARTVRQTPLQPAEVARPDAATPGVAAASASPVTPARPWLVPGEERLPTAAGLDDAARRDRAAAEAASTARAQKVAQGLASARAALAAGRVPEAVSLLETLVRAAPQLAGPRTLLAEARAQLAASPAVSPPVADAPAPLHASRPPTESPSLHDYRASTPPPAEQVGQPRADVAGPPTPPPKSTPRQATGQPVQPAEPLASAGPVGLASTPTALPPIASLADEALAGPGGARPRPGSQPEGSRALQVMLVGALVALVALAFVGFQRLGMQRSEVVPGPAVAATPVSAGPTAQPVAAATDPPAGPTATPAPTAADLFPACEAAVNAANWADATVACERVQAEDARYPGLASALASTYVGLGKAQLIAGTPVRTALEAFDKALAAKPDDAEAAHEREAALAYEQGEAALAAENWPTAVERFEALSTIAPEYLENAGERGLKPKLYAARLGWGRALQGAGEYAEAKRRCEEALDLAPESAEGAACRDAAALALAPASPPAPAVPYADPRPVVPAPPRQPAPQPQPQAPRQAPAPVPQPPPQAPRQAPVPAPQPQPPAPAPPGQKAPFVPKY